jgi:hypothetical protein
METLVRGGEHGLQSFGRRMGGYAISCASRFGWVNAWSILCLFMLGMVIAGCGGNVVSMGSAPEEEESLLFSAIGSGDLETVRAEISRDASLLNQVEGSFVQTPLHKAVRSNQLEIARFLIESGADVNLFDNLLRTPLATAMDVEAGPEFVQLLEEHGAVD